MLHVASELPKHGRGGSVQAPGDPPDGLAALDAGEDLLSLREAKVAAAGGLRHSASLTKPLLRLLGQALARQPRERRQTLLGADGHG